MDSFHMSDAEKPPGSGGYAGRAGRAVRVVGRRIAGRRGRLRGISWRRSGGSASARWADRAPDRVTLGGGREVFAGWRRVRRCGPSRALSRHLRGVTGVRRHRRPRRLSPARRMTPRGCGPVARNPRTCGLEQAAAVVEENLAEDWSPQQIAGWCPGRQFADEPEMRVSNERSTCRCSRRTRGAAASGIRPTLPCSVARVMRRPRARRGCMAVPGQIVRPRSSTADHPAGARL